MRYIATVDDQEFLIEILDEKHLSINGKVMQIDFESIGDQPVYSLLVDGQSFEAYVYPSETEWQVLLRGHFYPVKVEDARIKRLKAEAGVKVVEQKEFRLRAPMPGLVIDVLVKEGDEVEEGSVLVILESMKMQNELKSPRPGKVSRLRIEPGDSVEQNQTLLSVI